MTLDARLASRLGLRTDSLIREIQRDLIEDRVSVSSVLRKARLAAKKLDLAEFCEWIEQESDGYRNVLAKDMPKYRRVSVTPKFLNPYRGWCPILIESRKIYDLCHQGYVHQSVDEIETLTKSGDTLIYLYPKELCDLLRRGMEFDFEIRGFCSSPQLSTIPNAVKNILLDWAIELEKAGVLGEGLGFTRNDVAEAAAVTQNIYAQNVGAVGNISDQATVHNTLTGNTFSIDRLEDYISQISGALPGLPDEIRGPVEAELKKSKSLKKQGKSTLVRTCLTSIQKICEGAATSLAAKGIAAYLAGIL